MSSTSNQSKSSSSPSLMKRAFYFSNLMVMLFTIQDMTGPHSYLFENTNVFGLSSSSSSPSSKVLVEAVPMNFLKKALCGSSFKVNPDDPPEYYETYKKVDPLKSLTEHQPESSESQTIPAFYPTAKVSISSNKKPVAASECGSEDIEIVYGGDENGNQKTPEYTRASTSKTRVNTLGSKSDFFSENFICSPPSNSRRLTANLKQKVLDVPYAKSIHTTIDLSNYEEMYITLDVFEKCRLNGKMLPHLKKLHIQVPGKWEDHLPSSSTSSSSSSSSSSATLNSDQSTQDVSKVIMEKEDSKQVNNMATSSSSQTQSSKARFVDGILLQRQPVHNIKLYEQDVAYLQRKFFSEKFPELQELNLVDEVENKNLLILSIEKGYHPILRRLLPLSKNILHKQDHRGASALSLAIRYGKNEVLEEMLQLITHINGPIEKNGKNALMIAASIGEMPTIRRLLEVPKINVNTQNKKTGQTALMYAAENGKAYVAAKLMKYKADRSMKDSQGHDAVWHASQNNHQSMVNLLSIFPETK